MPIDPAALARSLARLAAGDHPADYSSLQAVAEACVGIFGVTGSGIMMADREGVPRYVAATDGPGRILEQAESQTGQGPCTEAFVTGEVVPVADVAVEPRWPELRAMLAGHGIHAVLGAPVRLGGITVATIDVYRDHPHDWDEGEQAAIARYSDVVGTTLAAALAVNDAQALARQLQHALDYRVVIERGVGYLMARDRIDDVTAFGRLRRAARNTQTRIGQVAERLLDTGRLPTEPS